MNPFLELLVSILNLVNIALFVWIVLGFLMQFNIVNRHHPFVYRLNDFLSRLFNPLLKPIRRFIPTVSGIDLSPIVLILLLNFIASSIKYYGS